ncbi:Hypothetical predicted protein [Mytilus galloprovincialis]|uniref:BTB domain-containing protein n=1 Tax=Mytilus galloprovincialis TaxID=29158 RepID=A0A8B6CYE5_MYTGA|nr:Hypothetical predicted protein [Mytilus galloprovincialis]
MEPAPEEAPIRFVERNNLPLRNTSSCFVKPDKRSIPEEDVAGVSIVDDIEAISKLSSPFNEPNVAFVIEGRKLYVQKEQLVAVSPVFEALFSDKFLEGSKAEIPLPDKNLNNFVRFLRYLCPGFDDELTEDIVHHMLPLADEYQTDGLQKRIEKFLVNSVLSGSDTITSDEIILKILEAEKYNVSDYLDKCITVASRKQFQSLTKSPKFKKISKNTKIKISFKRWDDRDQIYNKSLKVNSQFRAYEEHTKQSRIHAQKQHIVDMADLGRNVESYMQDN